MQEITVKMCNWKSEQEETIVYVGRCKLAFDNVLTITNRDGEVVAQHQFGMVPKASTVVLNWWTREIEEKPSEGSQVESVPIFPTECEPTEEGKVTTEVAA